MRPPTPLDPHERLLVFTWRIPHASAAVVGAVPADDETIARLAALPGLSGAFGLATCQRRLFVMLTERSAEGSPADLPARLATALGPRATALPPPEVFHGWAAVEHLAAVASGLDALVQGESEVGGQFRRAVADAEARGHLGSELTRLLVRAVRVARNVRRTPGYGRVPSVLPLLQEPVANVAAQAASEGRGLHAAVVGTGRMGRAAHQWLRQFAPERLYIVSRDARRATEVAERLHEAHPLTLQDFTTKMPQVDLIIVALPTEAPLVLPQHVQTKNGPVLIADLSLPRAVAPAVAERPQVTLLHIEDLASETQPHHAAHLALQAEIADWRRRASVEKQQERIDRLDKALRDEIEALLHTLAPADPHQSKEMRRRLARMRHIALEQLTDALTAQPERPARPAPPDAQETAA